MPYFEPIELVNPVSKRIPFYNDCRLVAVPDKGFFAELSGCQRGTGAASTFPEIISLHVHDS